MSIFKLYAKYKWALALLDLLLLNLGFGLALYASVLGFLPDYITSFSFSGQWAIFIPYSILALFYFQYCNLYKIQNIYIASTHIFVLLKTLFFTIIGFIIFQFLLNDFQVLSRLFYLNLFIAHAVAFVTVRPVFVKLIARQAIFQDKVVIIGAGKKGKAMLHIFKNKIKIKNVIGFVDDNVYLGVVQGAPVLGKVEDIVEVAKTFKVNLFLLAIDNISRERFFEIFKLCQQHQLNLSVSSDYLRVLNEKLEIDTFDEFGLVRFRNNDGNKLLRTGKRMFDILFASIGILMISSILITIAFLVKLTSRGPIFYSQIRIGKDGKPFYFYKFRSMYVNSDKDRKRKEAIEAFIKGGNGNSNKKVINHKNITAIGKILRKYSLDELPQLFNVLKGDMSLVGPRPCVLNEWKAYEEWQRLRLSAIPGCTGIWQVKGKGEVDFEETVLMDIFYNQNYSPWLDVKIILKTIPVMLLGKGDN